MKISEDCTLPATFTISNFVTIGSSLNATMNSTMFHFIDSDTGIDTNCYQNSSSVSATSPTGGATRYPCDDTVVEFIYSRGKLTLLEVACPEKYVSFLSQITLR